MTEPLPVAPAYEPPRIERVLTPEDLEREILYAGVTDLLVSLSDER
jgi:hypothetical protein